MLLFLRQGVHSHSIVSFSYAWCRLQFQRRFRRCWIELLHFQAVDKRQDISQLFRLLFHFGTRVEARRRHVLSEEKKFSNKQTEESKAISSSNKQTEESKVISSSNKQAEESKAKCGTERTSCQETQRGNVTRRHEKMSREKQWSQREEKPQFREAGKTKVAQRREDTVSRGRERTVLRGA